MSTRKSYTECVTKYSTYSERAEYLRCDSKIGFSYANGARQLQESFLRSERFKRVRDEVILRDNGCDMALPGYVIPTKQNRRHRSEVAIVHHINPVTRDQLIRDDDCLYDPENLILVSDGTHRYIHYGRGKPYDKNVDVERRKDDTTPWKVNQP